MTGSALGNPTPLSIWNIRIRNGAALTSRFRKSLALPELCSVYIFWYAPVSYTHLDVYKRQIMHHAAAILGDHRQAVQGAFGIQDGMEREFQMRGHTGGLAVKDIPVIGLIAGVVRGIGSFLVGGGDDLALRGRGNGDFSREGPCAVVLSLIHI